MMMCQVGTCLGIFALKNELILNLYLNSLYFMNN